MRDFRDAKAMAQSLREALAAKSVTVSHSESLELIAKALGAADWNTLSAAITDREPGEASTRGSTPDGPVTLPAFPIRDIVPFPAMQFPLFIGRQKTVRALTQAFTCRRELVLVTQKAREIDEPGPDDVYDVGVVARVIDVGPAPSEWLARHPDVKAATKVLLQTERRVRIREFSAEGEGYQAGIDEIDEGAIPDAPALIERAATQFEHYRAAHNVVGPEIIPPLAQLHDPGRVADVIAARIGAPLGERQAILATLDPVERLRRVVAHLDA